MKSKPVHNRLRIALFVRVARFSVMHANRRQAIWRRRTQTLGHLLQEFVWLAPQCFSNAHKTGQRKVIFAAFDSANKCPVHVSEFSKCFLRQFRFLSKCPHIFGHPLAILFIHARQFWRKTGRLNIEVKTIVYNTSHELFGLTDFRQAYQMRYEYLERAKNQRRFLFWDRWLIPDQSDTNGRTSSKRRI